MNEGCMNCSPSFSSIAVCEALISSSEKNDEESLSARMRCQTLLQLCRMNPWEAMAVRSLCVRIFSSVFFFFLLTCTFPDYLRSSFVSISHVVLLYIQVEMCKMPGVAVTVTMDATWQQIRTRRSSRANISVREPCPESTDVVTFLSGALLSDKSAVRSIFCHWVKVGQRVSFIPHPSTCEPFQTVLLGPLF